MFVKHRFWLHLYCTVKKALTSAMILSLIGLYPLPANALGSDIGDAIAPVPGHDLLAGYVLANRNSSMYKNGDVVSRQAKLKATTSIIRYAHPIALGDFMIGNPQFVLFHSNLSPDNVVGLRHTSGLADPLVGFPIWLHVDRANNNYFVIGPYVFLPIGEYDHNDLLNPGENRWKATVQALYQRGLGPNWRLELVAEATVYGKNNEYGPSKMTLRQRPWYETKVAFNYQFDNPAHTLVGGGLYYNIGGETKLDNNWQGDRTKTTGFYSEISTFVTASDQILFGYYRDLDVESGFKMDQQLRVRILHVF